MKSMELRSLLKNYKQHSQSPRCSSLETKYVLLLRSLPKNPSSVDEEDETKAWGGTSRVAAKRLKLHVLTYFTSCMRKGQRQPSGALGIKACRH